MGSPSLATACGKLAIAARHPLGNDGPLGLAITAGILLELVDSDPEALEEIARASYKAFVATGASERRRI